ncbi:molybdopterin-synthase adenylyltransferase MoeB [Candidatus Magnetobacterium casense]|uniref:Molybdopterin-synthase adenylyltransferase MoeB n=1 Tax=Candidatus Magnetobacterium casense TaxID=1455061 RepID=A0ABS6RVU4_9BACT|nr:molybdopterin-synthase adenylyltransferase MoeB [Candidatus Magnetobacterium casensis]MBV6340737.1 molybdopterin-synthase adenylyltransferase MoeB [Candidatus Magnetobacterium casensis]
MDFTEDQVLRYSRHIILPEIGGKGQAKIAAAKVFLVGAGGLGSPVGYFLTAAGVGRIAIIDDDHVELSNLQRQIAHSTKTLGMPKVQSAKETFNALNPEVEIVALKQRLTRDNILELIKDYDIVVDGSDNFPTRYLVNDACVMAGKPLVSGAILRFEGQVTTILPKQGHCYRCLFEDMPPPGLVPSCQEAGVLGVLPGIVGGLQAMEVLKLIIDKGDVLKNTLLIIDALKTTFRKVKVPKNPKCPVCGENPTITELQDYNVVYCSV